MFPTLETERLVLRKVIAEDAENIYAYFSNEEVTKHYGMNAFTELSEAEALVQNFATSFHNKRAIRWAIERKEQAGLIGNIGFNLSIFRQKTLTSMNAQGNRPMSKWGMNGGWH